LDNIKDNLLKPIEFLAQRIKAFAVTTSKSIFALAFDEAASIPENMIETIKR
jgi:hypothetical protein